MSLIGHPAASSPYWSHSILNYLYEAFTMRSLVVHGIHVMHQRVRQRYEKGWGKVKKNYPS